MKTILSLSLCFNCITLLAQLDDSPIIEFPDTIYYQYPEVVITTGEIRLPDNTEFADTINDPFGIIYTVGGTCYLSIQKGKNNYTFSITEKEELYDNLPEISISRFDLYNHKHEELVIDMVQDFWHAGSCGGGGYTNKRILIWDLDQMCKLFGVEYYYESSSFQNTGCFPPEDLDSTTVFEGEWVEDYLEEEKYRIEFRSETITITPEKSSTDFELVEYHNYTGTEKVIYRLKKKYMLRIK